jgi:hypothetical protein
MRRDVKGEIIWPSPGEGLRWKVLHSCRRHYEEAGLWRMKDHEKEYWGRPTAFDEEPEYLTYEDVEGLPGSLSNYGFHHNPGGSEDLMIGLMDAFKKLGVELAEVHELNSFRTNVAVAAVKSLIEKYMPAKAA